MNDDDDILYYTNPYSSNWGNFGVLTTTDNSITARISNDDWYQVGIRESDKVESLEKEIKKLKRQIANLTTLICTHIGEEQMKNFNEKNG
jgi:hypothetical protein